MNPICNVSRETKVDSWLFSDAEPAENLTEQIIRCEFPGNLAQCALRQAQLLGEQLRAGHHGPRLGQVEFSQRQGAHVTFPRHEGAAFLVTPSHCLKQLAAQLLYARAR